jgi:hypothetical protein
MQRTRSALRGVDEERELAPAPTGLCLSLCAADDLPPVEQVATAPGLMFDGDAIVLARHVTRAWTVPGRHLEPGETPEQACAGRRAPSSEIPCCWRSSASSGWRGRRRATDTRTRASRFRPEEARVAPGWVQDQRELYEEALRWATTETSG